jgi:hypothetical protein
MFPHLQPRLESFVRCSIHVLSVGADNYLHFLQENFQFPLVWFPLNCGVCDVSRWTCRGEVTGACPASRKDESTGDATSTPSLVSNPDPGPTREFFMEFG